MNIQEYLIKIKEIESEKKLLFDFCQHYVQDQSIDVWHRFDFFANYALKEHYEWNYYNDALENITRMNPNIRQLFDNLIPGDTVNCVREYLNFIKRLRLEIDIEDGDEAIWSKIGEVFGIERQITTYRGQFVAITKKQLESILEQQMKDYVHTFVFDW